tara:strand:- start:108 stop:494 length:387 start_codon:yes stop_codon:yes gene_type:complete
MKRFFVFFCVFISGFCSAYPMKDIYENLDVSSFPSSLMQKIQGDKNKFSDLKLLPKPVFKESEFIIESDYWLYKITIFKENRRGIHICFLDHAKQSSYDAQKPMVIRKYGERYVAIRLYSDVCEIFAR